MNTAIRRAGCSFVVALILAAPSARAQLGAVPATVPATAPAGELVVLDFPADGVELKVLADIVTRRLGIPIIYDEAIEGKKVILRVPLKVPEDALLGILQSALRMKQLALVDAEQPGWKQIVAAQNLATVARPAVPGQPLPAGTAVTQVIAVRQADPARLVEAVRPLLTQPGGNVLAVPGQRILVVSDYPSVVTRIEQVVRLLDSAGPPVEIRFVPLREADAGTVVSTVTQLLATRETFLFGNPAGSGIFLTADDRLNQVVVVAPGDRVQEVVELITGMDRPQDLSTKVYRLRSIAPERLDRMMKELLGATKRGYSASVDRESQALVVSATPQVLKRIDTLVAELDQPITADASPIRFYRLKNTKALDVLATIEGLIGQSDVAGESAGAEGGELDVAPLDGAVAPGSEPNGARPEDRGVQTPVRSPPEIGEPQPPGVSGRLPRDRMDYDAGTDLAADFAGAETALPSVRSAEATVSADVNTNSIIVIAAPSVQQLYADLITRLDVRRPQVQIECTIVTLDTSDNFEFAVDAAISGSSGDNSIISFSSFGVSIVDPITGSLTPRLGRGGTFALLSPGNADIVIRALAQHSRARLISTPQLLVNDNGKGQLRSVAQEPYAEIIDSTSSQAITSFGGQAEAGTSILVEPHISEDDYLQLGYTVELSNFTGQARSGLPPPSQSNSVTSTVTIPDGYTIVVGGLSTKNFRTAVDSIPGLDQVPFLRYLFGARSRTVSDRTLFVFIRPLILRDDKFEDLKFLSGRAMDVVELGGDFPPSEPIPMR